MPDRVKGITIELNGDVTPLNKALSSANKEIKNTQTALKDVEKLLKLDPKNVQLLEQRQRLLAQAVEETKKKLETLKEAEKQAQQQFAKGEISQEQYEALQREIIATEQQLQSLEKAAANSNARLQHLAAVTQEISDKTGEFAEKTKGLSLAAAGVVTALGGMALKAVTASDDLNTLAAQTGFSTDELQKMQYAADRVDVSMETITGAASRLKRQMTSTSSSVTSAFQRLGVSALDTNGNLRDSTAVFWDVIDGLSQIENETERDTVAMELFGKSADQLAGIIDDGGASFRALGKEAESMGLILSQKTLNGLNAVNDRLDQLKAQAQGVIAVNGAKVVEAFLPLIEDAANGLGNLAERVASLDSAQIKSIATVAAVVAGISPVAGLISNISGAASGLMSVLPGLFALISAHPFGAAAVAVTGLVTAITAFAKASAEAPASVDSLTKSAQGLDKAISDASATYDTNTAAITRNYEKGQILLKRLADLETQTGRTALEEHERNTIVAELNDLYPELNLSIDENTGNLSENVFMIMAQTKALKDAAIQQALQEKFNAILDAMADAQVEVYENQLALRDATDKYSDANDRATDLARQLKEAEDELYTISTKNAEAYNAAAEKAEELRTQYAMASADAEVWKNEVDKLTDAISVGESKVAEYAAEYETAVTGISSILSGAGESAGSAFGAGLARGMDNQANNVSKAAQRAAAKMEAAAKYQLGIASPSKVAAEIGEFFDLGLVKGLKNYEPRVSDASESVAQIMTQPVSNASNVTNNSSTTHNVGGISVTVNASPGQDVQELAEAVMEEIQAAVEREGAAL